MKTCKCCKEDLPLSSFRVRGDKACYYPDSHCIPCRRSKDNLQRGIRIGKVAQPEVEQPDRSYVPPADFLAMGPAANAPLVWGVGVAA